MQSRSCWLIVMAATLVAVCGVAPGIAAQDERMGSANGSTITGTIEVDGGGRVSERYDVAVRKVTGAATRHVTSDPSGRFSIPGVEAGTYTLTVRPSAMSPYLEGSAEVIVITASSTLTYTATIFLKRKDQDAITRTPAGRTFSAQESDATVPKAARKEYRNGVKAAHANNTVEAIACFQRALAIAPDYLFALNDLGVQFTRLNRYTESAELLRKAVALAPKSFPPHLNLAIALLGLGDTTPAVDEVRSALAIDPSAHDALFISGMLERKLGHTDAAIAAFQKAFDAGGADAVMAQFELGQLYDSIGQNFAAAKAYQTFLQFVTTGPQAEIARKRLKALGVA